MRKRQIDDITKLGAANPRHAACKPGRQLESASAEAQQLRATQSPKIRSAFLWKNRSRMSSE
jgi:hypothetical protein